MIARALVALLLVGTLTACDEAPAPSGSAPTPSAATTPTEPAAYLPVPEGVVLSAPGTELGLGEPAVAAWTPRQDLVGVVEVAVVRVVETTVAESLAGYRFDGADATATPYFVTTRVTNLGESDLGGRQLPLYVVDGTGRLVAPTGIDPGFRPCPDATLPDPFPSGTAARSCLIFLVPRGATLAAVTFRPTEGVAPISWTGPVDRRR